MSFVSLQDVTKAYPAPGRGTPSVVAVNGVSLEIEAGDVYGIIGYSGAGKSTLVRLINALEPATSGSIAVAGREIVGLRDRELRGIRRGIGMIFQQFNLFDQKTVRGNIGYPLKVAGWDRSAISARVDELLEFVGLADKAGNYPDQLSGGQKQRVGIARALATRPQLLLADEATSALDPETTQGVLDLLRRVNEEQGVTVVAITHEMDVIQSIATKVAVMDAGRVIEHGDVFDVFANPQQPASARFVSTVVKGVPNEVELAALRSRYKGRIVTFSFRGDDTDQAQVFRELTSAELGFELVYGGINEIRGRAFGHLTLAISANGVGSARDSGPESDQVDAALARIAKYVEVTEVAS